MDPLFIQLIIGVVLVIMGLFIFKFYPMKLDIKMMVIMALFVAISSVLSLFSFMVPLFGFPALKLGFSQLPLMIGGALFGPAIGFLSGILVDTIGIVTGTSSPYFIGFTLNAVFVGVIMGVWYQISKKLEDENIFRVMIFLQGLIAGIGIWFLVTQNQMQDGFVIDLTLKVIGIAMIVIFTIFSIAFGKYMLVKRANSGFMRFMVGVILVEVVVQFICTPLWLMVMYEIPYIYSLLVRVFKAIIMIQANSFIGFGVYKAIIMKEGRNLS